MQEEEQLSEQESLELITRMINKAKCEYAETGLSALLWGSVISFCSVVSFIGYYYNYPSVGMVWWLTLATVVVQIVLSVRERRKRKFKTYNDDAMGGIWISFGVAMFLLSFYVNTGHIDHPNTLFLIAYGIPTFATGFTRHFKPMIAGAIICWILSIINIYTPFPYNTLYSAVAAQVAWFIPGLILRRRYMKAKKQHV